MAQTIIEASPALLSFAGNPIVYKVSTDKSLGDDESFLRIVCKAVFSLNGSVAGYTGSVTFTDEQSQPVGDRGTAVFNLSESAKTLIRNIQSGIDMNSGDALSSYGIKANVEFKAVWLYENNEYSTDVEAAPVIYIVPGGLTDYEMITMGDIYLPSLTGNGREMTRKPDGGIVYAGEKVIVPTLRGIDSADKTVTVSFMVSGSEIYRSSDIIEGFKLDYQTASPENESVEGEFVFNSSLTGPITGYYRTNTSGVYFLRFINGFGAVENISVRSREKLSYEVSGETHSLVQQISTRPTDRRYATKSQPVGVYELSSGYVPRRWAEWYVQELLTSTRVWIQIGGKWVPALIEAEDDCVIYDRSKPGMPHVDFTLRLAIDGVTGVVW